VILAKEVPLSFAIVSLLLLVVVAIVVIPILMRVFGEAAGRNENRPGDEGDETREDRDQRSDGG
jgi:hypothetical protein